MVKSLDSSSINYRTRSISLGRSEIVQNKIDNEDNISIIKIRNEHSKNNERHSRYWTFLFDHLNRIVDEMYQNCEEDESIDECREVILNLQNHIRDFESLIEWVKLNKDFETTPQRPSSVSWEVRKRLPEKSLFSCYLNEEKVLNSIKNEEISTMNQQMDFNNNNNDNRVMSNSIGDDYGICMDNSISNHNNKSMPNMKYLPDHNDDDNNDDDQGFKMVTNNHGRRNRQRNKVAELKIIDNHCISDNYSNNSSNYNDRIENNSNINGNVIIGDNRAPCRVLKLHEKFSSPSRRRQFDQSDTLKKQEQKQAKAQEAREKLLEKRGEKFKDIFKKVEEIRQQKEEQQIQMRLSMEMRLQKAGEKRQEQLNKIVRKAHDEDEKVSEILFINSLEADTKKHEIFSKEKVHESRMQDLQEERQRKLEEKATKEKAFEERRKAIEAEKQARIEKLKEQRKLKVMKIQKQFQDKEKERLELAFQKELDRKSKISALNALLAAEKEELQKKILAKQEESKRRHEENMEQIRQKALELSVKKSSNATNDDVLVCVPYDTTKMCQLCKILIKSEVYLIGHLRGKKHNDAVIEQNNGRIPSTQELENFNLKYIVDYAQTLNDNSTNNNNDDLLLQDCDNEKLLQAKKKSKKLKQKLLKKSMEFENNFNLYEDIKPYEINVTNSNNNQHKSLMKLIKDLNVMNSNDKIIGQWPSNMVHNFERIILELDKLFARNFHSIIMFHRNNGLCLLTKILSRILQSTSERRTSLTDNANNRLISMYCRLLLCYADNHQLQRNDFRVCRYFFRSQNILIVQEIFYHRLNLCVNSTTSSSTTYLYDSVIGSLCELFSMSFDKIFDHYSTQTFVSNEDNNNSDDNIDESPQFMRTHIKEIINYLVLIGVVDKLSMILQSYRGSINELPKQSLFIKQIIKFLSSLAKLLILSSHSDVENDTNNHSNNSSHGKHDGTQFMLTLKVTQLCGIVSLLYGLLLHTGTPVRGEKQPLSVPDHTLNVTLEMIKFFNYLLLIDVNLIQSILGSEGLSLQIRHICSYLLWYCSHYNNNSDLLNEVILFIGNFVVLNNDNQTLLQSGQRPTVVQQLCSLSFDYFSEEKLKNVLFPTLIACCYDNDHNLNILKQEMSTTMLTKYIEHEITDQQMKQLNSDEQFENKLSKRWSLMIRFPKCKWIDAKIYFENFN